MNEQSNVSEKNNSSESKSLAGLDRKGVVSRFQTHAGDTGSPEVQVAVLTHRLEGLTKHFESNKMDNHSRVGLMKIVSQRKRLLSYLKSRSITRYRTLIAELGLRK